MAKEVTNQWPHPPKDLLDSTHSCLTAPESHTPTQDISASPKKLVLERSVGCGMKFFVISPRTCQRVVRFCYQSQPCRTLRPTTASYFREKLLMMLEGTESKMAATSFGGSEKLNGTGEFVAFTCGHAFPLSRFHSKVILEFSNRVSDLPVSIPHTLRYLQLHYKQSSYYPSGCPYCVFQYLRKIQLPDVPIKPWNPGH